MQGYTAYEVAELLGTSHTTIYNKLGNKQVYKEIRNFVTKAGKTTLIYPEGIEILKKHIPNKENFKKDLFNVVNVNQQDKTENVDTGENKSMLESNQRFIESLQKQVEGLNKDKEILYKQLEVKDKHIFSLDEALKTEQNLNNQNQILLGQLQAPLLRLESKEVNKDQKKKNRFKWFGRG